jgi:hypothetical protein
MDPWPFFSCTSGCAGFWRSLCRPDAARPTRMSSWFLDVLALAEQLLAFGEQADDLLG